jgi:hypothetical protein
VIRTHEYVRKVVSKLIQMFEHGNRTHDMFEKCKVKSIFMLKLLNDTRPMVENWV